MPESIKDRKSKKVAPIVCAVLMIGIMAACLAALCYPMLDASVGGMAVMGILALYGILIVAIIIGVIVALVQRLKEIEGGEEDAAAQY